MGVSIMSHYRGMSVMSRDQDVSEHPQISEAKTAKATTKVTLRELPIIP